MKNLIKIKDHKNLLRDLNTNAVINVDQQEYENYLKKRKSIIKKDEKVDQLQNEIEELKDSLNEMKDLVKLLINKNLQP
jgi:hypothetical protein